jgi:hypothetical protein
VFEYVRGETLDDVIFREDIETETVGLKEC